MGFAGYKSKCSLIVNNIGMRRYKDGARLLTHVDRQETHAVSVIINLEQVPVVISLKFIILISYSDWHAKRLVRRNI